MKKEQQKRDLLIVANDELEKYVTALDAACLLYSKKTKCLEWACALIILLARNGLKASLVIGIQNRPFFSHAWVENSGCVVGDDPERRSQLAVIYDSTSDLDATS